MKFKKLGSICKSHGQFCIWNDVSEEGELRGQWMGTAAAVYALDGLPTMSQNVVCAIFDITEKQQINIIFQEGNRLEGIDTADSVANEYPVELERLTVNWCGKELIPLYTSRGIMFIDAEYLAPLEDVADMLTFYERRGPSGVHYIAAKAGMWLAAILMPYEVGNDQIFVDKISEMALACEKKWERRG